jgi:hypothetical protein
MLLACCCGKIGEGGEEGGRDFGRSYHGEGEGLSCVNLRSLFLLVGHKIITGK